MTDGVRFPRASYPRWRQVVDFHLLTYTGRALADLPISDYPLVTWWGHGVKAHTVAALLATLPMPPRATLRRFYTDTRADAVREEMLAGV